MTILVSVLVRMQWWAGLEYRKITMDPILIHCPQAGNVTVSISIMEAMAIHGPSRCKVSWECVCLWLRNPFIRTAPFEFAGIYQRAVDENCWATGGIFLISKQLAHGGFSNEIWCDMMVCLSQWPMVAGRPNTLLWFWWPVRSSSSFCLLHTHTHIYKIYIYMHGDFP